MPGAPGLGPGRGSDPFDLERFVAAQRPVYDQVVDELRRGRKTSHWIWFIFPQVAGLGQSAMAQRFAIASFAEARAYLTHPLLGARLRECGQLMLDAGDRSAEEILGGIDARKLRSSMTLFHRAAPDEGLFSEVLARFFAGIDDPKTDELRSSQLRRST
jgi:uncharacterized protein (DUF1810 family)